MQIIFSRIIPFLDVQTLAPRQAREVLLRDAKSNYLLYLSDSIASESTSERLIHLAAREALIWLNETSQDEGSFWN